MKQTPLYEIHLDLGAEFGIYSDWELPKHYINPIEEYKAIKNLSAIIDRTYLGKLRIYGKDAIDFLNRISTNDLRGLSPGMGVGTVLTDEKGKMIEVLTLYILKATEDYQEVFALLSYEALDKVKNWLSKLIIMDDVKVEDITDDYVIISIFGSDVHKAVEDDFKVDHKRFTDISKMTTHNFVQGFIFNEEVILSRTDEFLVPGYNLIFRSAIAIDVWRTLHRKGLTPVGREIFEVFRVESGIPAYGKEITQDYNPLEANLVKYVSFTKGCYIGQEVISRIDSYKKLQKKLVGFIIEKGKGRERIYEGSSVCIGGEEVGKLTSIVYSYGFQKLISLGYIKINHAIQGEKVEIKCDDGSNTATVIIPPFSI